MSRTRLSDNAWERIKNILTQCGRVYNKYEHRHTVEGVLYRMCTGVQWRDLSVEFGLWSTVLRRFNLWSKKGLLTLLFKGLSQEHDCEWLFIDDSIVKAHQDSAGV